MTTCAVVVTYNRKQLLTECINGLTEQNLRPDKILVIDNLSTDGTDQLFSANGRFCLEYIEYRRMEKNLGGAGGFYEGVRLAWEQGFDWIWIMDDDTIPTPSALEEMLRGREKIAGEVSFLASAVYGTNNEPMNVPDLDYRRSGNGYPDWYYYSYEGIIKIESATFVSILINRNAVSKVGFPYKKLFIWGDDKEYTLRMTHLYAPAYLIGKSIVIHKRAVAKRISIENENDPKRINQFYYNYRNILVNTQEYSHGIRSVLKRMVEFNLLGTRILLDNSQEHKWKKVATIHKGILGYIFGTHDRKAFKERAEIKIKE